MRIKIFDGTKSAQAMIAHLLLKMQLSQCSTISPTLNLSTQPKDMQSSWLNSQRVLGRACWLRNGFWKLKKGQETSSPRKGGMRGINTPLIKTSCCNCQCRLVRPVPQTGQTGLFKLLAVIPRSVRPAPHTGLGQRSRNPNLGAPLGPLSQHLVIQVA